ncbi:MAG: FapA family protein [Bacteroidales bacterium]|nr:FapA family protein [Candidatus Latescibacterota bacterium]
MDIENDKSSEEKVPATPESSDQAEEIPLKTRLYVSSDKLAILLDSPHPGDGLQGLLDDVETRMKELGLSELPDRSVLEERISEKLEPDSQIIGLVMVEGVEPIQGKDGWIEWEEDFFMTGFKVDDESGRMDFWERLEHLCVSEGQVLARVYPRFPGIPGIDVFGEAMSCENTFDLEITIGSNIEITEEEEYRTCSSGIDGRMRWANNTLAVDEVYRVHGDIRFGTGNVHYNGSVMVEGDVKDGATVDAGGDIIISGLVEPSNITSKGSLIVSGGIIGNENHRIELEGGLHARYLTQAEVLSCEDVEVTRDISQSNIRTLGQVIIPQGRIVGGEVTANRGIQVGQAGSPGETPTTLIPGTDYSLPGKLAEPRERAKSVSTEFEKIKDITDSVLQRKRMIAESEFDKLMKQQKQLEKELHALHATIMEIKRKSTKQAVREVHVLKRTFPGVRFKFRKMEFSIDELTEGLHVWTKDDGKKQESQASAEVKSK